MRARWCLALGCVVAALLVSPRVATADNDANWARGIADAINGENLPIRGLFLASGAGWEYPDRLALHADVGYGWGTNDTGMLGGKSATHLSASSSVSAVPGHGSVELDLALLFGASGSGMVSGGLAGGLEVHLGDEVLLGPVAKLRVGYGAVVLYLQLGARLNRNQEQLNLGVGLEYFRLP